jgi:hypothetical protein
MRRARNETPGAIVNERLVFFSHRRAPIRIGERGASVAWQWRRQAGGCRCMGGGKEPVRERVSRAGGSGDRAAVACGAGAESTTAGGSGACGTSGCCCGAGARADDGCSEDQTAAGAWRQESGRRYRHRVVQDLTAQVQPAGAPGAAGRQHHATGWPGPARQGRRHRPR